MKIFCLGDSITDCGRLFDDYPLGNGYVKLLSQKFFQNNPKASSPIELKNYGTDGFTVSRILDNVLQKRIPFCPSCMITLLIGINDIGLMKNTRHSDLQQEEMMKEFFIRYDRLLALLTRETPAVILMEPFIFPFPEEYKLWIPQVKQMSQGIEALASKYSVPYLLLHDHFNEIAAQSGYPSITIDGIHLTTYGQQILSDKLYPLILAAFDRLSVSS